MVSMGLIESMTFEQRLEGVSQAPICGNSIPGRENNCSKDLRVEASLVCVQQSLVWLGVESAGDKLVGEEVLGSGGGM